MLFGSVLIAQRSVVEVLGETDAGVLIAVAVAGGREEAGKCGGSFRPISLKLIFS